MQWSAVSIPQFLPAPARRTLSTSSPRPTGSEAEGVLAALCPAVRAQLLPSPSPPAPDARHPPLPALRRLSSPPYAGSCSANHEMGSPPGVQFDRPGPFFSDLICFTYFFSFRSRDASPFSVQIVLYRVCSQFRSNLVLSFYFPSIQRQISSLFFSHSN